MESPPNTKRHVGPHQFRQESSLQMVGWYWGQLRRLFFENLWGPSTYSLIIKHSNWKCPINGGWNGKINHELFPLPRLITGGYSTFCQGSITCISGLTFTGISAGKSSDDKKDVQRILGASWWWLTKAEFPRWDQSKQKKEFLQSHLGYHSKQMSLCLQRNSAYG